MEVFFNELSVRPASSDAEACQWLETLAELGQALQLAIESVNDEYAFTFRRSDDFGQLSLTATQTLFEFLQDQYDYGSAVYNFLLGVFDSPYITDTDPQRNEYEYTSITFNGKEYNTTGLGAAYLKNALAVSFDNDAVWDTCHVSAPISCLDADDEVVSSTEIIEHASRKQHLLDCHLPRLSDLFNWGAYRPHFDSDAKSLLPLLELCSLCVSSWKEYYYQLTKMNVGERVVTIEALARQIAKIHRWEPASGRLVAKNAGRLIFIVPNSDLLVTVDTQHGEFEVHANRSGNNHLGAISFDGKNLKNAIATRKLKV